MKLLHLGDVISSRYNKTFSYDDCVLALISQQENVSLSFLNPQGKTNFTSGVPEEALKRLLRIVSSSEVSDKCEYPVSRLDIKYAQEKSNDDWTFQKSIDPRIPSGSKLFLFKHLK